MTSRIREIIRRLDCAASCTGKVAYRRESAERAAAAMSDKYAAVYEAYPCRYCSRWHVGHGGSNNRWRIGIRFIRRDPLPDRCRGEE